MPSHVAARRGLTSVIGGHLRRRRRRRGEYDRIAFAELDIRRLDDRIDTLLEVLAQLCDYSGQIDAGDDFRALSGRWPESDASFG